MGLSLVVASFWLLGFLNTIMEFSKLTRKHAIRIASSFACSVEECALAVGKVVGYSSIKSAARMNNAVLIFVDSVEMVNTLVEKGISVNDTFVVVLPLAYTSGKSYIGKCSSVYQRRSVDTRAFSTWKNSITNK